ncbi:MAG TPA: winged helix-turn-helix domain-containing protein [Blastocatellia bacterium]|nr:winged helix-turn-helix domain-containing protein [Blastocatellia bacterium]
MGYQRGQVLEFGSFRIDAAGRRLLHDAELVPLKPKVFDTLLLLVESAGRVVTKDQLMQAIWPDTAVEENNLTQNIYTLRKVLGERPGEHRYIVTVPGRGYSFVADVRELGGDRADLLIGKLTRSRMVIEDELTVVDNGEAARKAFESSRRNNGRATLLAASVLGAALVGALIYFFALNGRSKQQLSGSQVRSIAVLPFKSLDPNEEDPSLGLKLADALIMRLGRLRQFAVRSTRAVGDYEGKAIDPIAAGRQQQVDAVLDVSFQRADQRLHVRARLLRASDGQQLWAGTFDERGSDPLVLQDALAEQTAQALLPRLTGAERQLLTRHDTENLDANRLYTEARYYWNKRDFEGIRKSVKLLEQAIGLDPNYARAHAGLADSYITLSDYYLLEASLAFPKAKQEAQKALEIDGSLAEAHTALAMIKSSYDWDWTGADQTFKQAIEINPHYATAHQWYAEFLIGVGRNEEALYEIRLAQQLDPLSLIIPSIEALVLYYARDYEGAIAQCRRVISRDPNFGEVYGYLQRAYEQKGMLREAMDAYQRCMTLLGYDTPEAAAIRAAPVLGAGDYWRKIVKLSSPPLGGHIEAAQALAHLGQMDKALSLLEQACNQRSYGVIYLGVEPNLDPLRSDPRFAILLRRVGLAQ